MDIGSQGINVLPDFIFIPSAKPTEPVTADRPIQRSARQRRCIGTLIRLTGSLFHAPRFPHGNDSGTTELTHETLLAFTLFALATSITPGPNNILLMTSGVNFGLRASVPHMLGVSAGFALLLLGTGFGLNELFSRHPGVYHLMKWLGVAYFIYFAWKLASAPIKPMISGAPNVPARAWRFRDAVAFQCFNPKGWIMAAGTFSSYVPSMSKTNVIVSVALLFSLIAAPCFLLWVTFGTHLRRYLEKGRRRRYFNVGMALLLLGSLVPLFVFD